MKIKMLVVLVLVILAATIGIKMLGNVSQGNKKYNLILISFDGLQSKHLNSYGYPMKTTPNLDDFLKSSSLFTKTVSPSSWTVPSHMSIFTSMYPSEHKVINKFSDFNLETQTGVIANLKKLSPNAVTLAEILKNNGYATGGFTGDAGVGPQFGFNQGFDTYFETETFGGLEGSAPKAVEWLKQNKDKPFFLFLHGYDVHGQHEPKGGFDYRYVTKPYTGKFTGNKVEQGKLREEALANGGTLEMSDEDIAFWRAIYDEKINRNDLEFKNFMDQVKEMDLMENTIVILMSDHGTEFFEHNSIDHGSTLYGELIDTLLAIHKPGQTKGQKIDQVVSTMDLMPTILDLLKIQNPVPQQTKGVDLVPALSGKNVAHNIFSETDYRLYTFKRSLVTTDGWKFILSLENGKKELFNLTQDPGEKNNLILTSPEKGFELEKILRQHIDETYGLRTGDQLGCSPVYGDQCKK
ncbi:MAG: sulfatase [Candidatus Shapirobacteria bacterium]